MTEEIAQFYRILELEPGASPEVVKQAYRELVKIWHPDRFPNDPKFQKRANEKTKEINEAYKKILAYQTGNWSESRLPRSGDESGAAARAEADAAKRVRQSQARERQVTMDPRDGGGLPEFAWRSARKLGTLFLVFNRYTLLYAALASVWVFFVKPSFFPSKAETFLNTKSAAEKGDVSAQFNLGWRYANGESIGQDYVEAAKWYRKAAEQGHTDAQSNLGWMYESGHGVPQNYG